MGSETGRDDERPVHRVYLDAYELDRYEVTNAQYRRFLLAAGGRSPAYWTGDAYPPGQADYPVVGVSWDDADAYCRWAGKRLPTEAEWEKACRGADGRVLSLGQHVGVEPGQRGRGGLAPHRCDARRGRRDRLGCRLTPVGAAAPLRRSDATADRLAPRRRQPLRHPGHGGQRLGVGDGLVQLVRLLQAAGAPSPCGRTALEPLPARLVLVRSSGHTGLDADAQPLCCAQLQPRDARSARRLPLRAPGKD